MYDGERLVQRPSVELHQEVVCVVVSVQLPSHCLTTWMSLYLLLAAQLHHPWYHVTQVQVFALELHAQQAHPTCHHQTQAPAVHLYLHSCWNGWRMVLRAVVEGHLLHCHYWPMRIVTIDGGEEVLHRRDQMAFLEGEKA